MVAWSTFVRSAAQNVHKFNFILPKFSLKYVGTNLIQARKMSSNTMTVLPSNWQNQVFKDQLHFYFMLAIIPLSLITFCANVFVGPATLTKIPEGYEPEYWEYYQNPITRFFARYIFTSPQKDYEKLLFAYWEESRSVKFKELEKKILGLQQERQDYAYQYFLGLDFMAQRKRREILKDQSYGILE